MTSQMILRCFVLVLGSLLAAHETAFSQTVSGDAKLLGNTPAVELLAVVGAVGVVGFVKVNDRPQVVLRDFGRRETHLFGEAEIAFGYRIKKIMQNSAVLETAGREFELRQGEYLSDITRIETAERQQSFERWRQRLSVLAPEDQRTAREQMREFWRQQWEARWHEVVVSMGSWEQERVRRHISNYWR